MLYNIRLIPISDWGLRKATTWFLDLFEEKLSLAAWSDPQKHQGWPKWAVHRQQWCSWAGPLCTDDTKNVTILALNFRNYSGFRAGAKEQFFKNLDSLSANLHTLDLCGLMKEESPGPSALVSRSPLLMLTFPKLVSLRIADVTLGVPTESQALYY